MTAARDLKRTLEIARATACEAGLVMLESYRLPQEVSFKGEVDLVTSIDVKCEEHIRRRLAESFPDDRVLAEESGASGPKDGSGLWHVDPLDGTTNYAHGHPFFCTSLALELEGELVVGVIHAPVLGLTWASHRGGGVSRNGRSVEVSKTTHLEKSLCASGFPYDRRTSPDNNIKEFSAVMRHCQGIRRAGSAAIDLACIADGTLDGYWEKKLHSWDIAAGVMMVREAGGRAGDLGGAPVPPWPETIVATNGRIHDELVETVRGESD